MQKDVLSLFEILEQKNSYLLEFHKLNMSELKRLSEGHLDNLENFYYSRELLLNAINKLDGRLAQNNWNDNMPINKMEKRRLETILDLKRKMVMSIVDQDLTIMSLIDQIKKGGLGSMIA